MDLIQRRRVMLAGQEAKQPQYLYNSGIISPLIGGFDTTKKLWTCPWPWNSAVLRDTYIDFRAIKDTERIAGALLPVDLTPYKVLCADINIYSTYLSYSAARIAIFTEPVYDFTYALTKTPEKGMGLGRMVVRIDISNINQIAYIAASVGGMTNYAWDLYGLWLEK